MFKTMNIHFKSGERLFTFFQCKMGIFIASLFLLVIKVMIVFGQLLIFVCTWLGEGGNSHICGYDPKTDQN